MGLAGGAEPVEVTADSLIAAAEWVDDYAKPMAERVYGDAALPVSERDASVLAKYIRRAKLRSINKRELKRSPHKSHLPSLRDTQAMDAAVELLVDAGWLLPNPSRDGVGAANGKTTSSILLCWSPERWVGATMQNRFRAPGTIGTIGPKAPQHRLLALMSLIARHSIPRGR
jgi:hypothetical protein